MEEGLQTAQNLISDILTKCQRERWYGSDLERHRRPSKDDPRHSRFAFPPATAGQIAQTEAIVGCPLPPLLVQLYSSIANGGFGPGGGIRGCVGGYGTPMSIGDDAGTLPGYYEWKRSIARLVDFSELSAQLELGTFHVLELPYDVWPIHLLHVADMGCGMQACVDADSQEMYWTHLSEHQGKFILEKKRLSLEEWLREWVRGADGY